MARFKKCNKFREHKEILLENKNLLLALVHWFGSVFDEDSKDSIPRILGNRRCLAAGDSV